MTNYDAVSGTPERDVADRRDVVANDHDAEFAQDQELDPVDRVEDALTGQFGEFVDSETIASWNLRRIRQVLGLSQQQLSDKLAELPGRSRLSQSQIAKIERGERPWRVNEMFDIAEALNISHFEFFRGQMLQDDPDLQMLAARLAYQQASESAREAEEAWHAAAMKERIAARKVINTAAYLGVKDPEAMKLLILQGAVELRNQHLLAEMDLPEEELVDLSDHVSRRKVLEAPSLDESEEWAEREWERILVEVEERKKAREQGSD